MKKKNKQGSRLRVDPFNLLHLLCEQKCTLSELQQRTGFDPAEMKPLRAAGKIHLDTLNRVAAGLDVSPNSLLITATSPWKAYHGTMQIRLVDFLTLSTSLLITALMTLGHCSSN